MDLTNHLNKLNLQLQGKNQLIHEMWRHILAFETKLRLWGCQLQKENYVPLPAQTESKPATNTKFVIVIQNLRTEFSTRFSEIRSLETQCKLFSTPFDVDVNAIPKEFRMDLIKLQCSDELKSKFYAEGTSLLDYNKKYLFETGFYPSLTNHAKNGDNVW